MQSECSQELTGWWKRAALTVRLLGLLAAVPAAALLVTAWRLSPDPSGMGTHSQLGLGRCSFLVSTGYPCPSCGMTTAFAAMAHGQLSAALHAQVFGAVLFMLTCGAFVMGAAQMSTGRNLFLRLRPSMAWLWLGLGGLGAGWIIRIVVGSNL